MTFHDIDGRYRQIKDYPNYYITEFGDVFSNRLRGWEKEPRLRKLTPKNPGNPDKYYTVILCNDSGQVTKSIHRLVAEYFVPGWFDGAVVNHIDGNNRNNVASNLEWTTAKDNVHKSYKTSGIGAKRNYKTWRLYNPNGELLGTFYSCSDLSLFIKENNINTSPSQLIKCRNSRGFKVIVE